MKENFKVLRKKFITIKTMGFIKPLRRGSTGLGYTFESLLGKLEDTSSLPDFNGIELKTKFGYSKSPLTLFNLAPKRKNESAIRYILDNYSWEIPHSKILIFSNEVYSKKINQKYNFNFKLCVNYQDTRIIMKSYKNGIFLENICYWDFKDLERKLKIKLSYLAIILGYPYRLNGQLHYKFLKMTTYKLKGFFEFLKLIDEDKINIKFYIKKTVII